MHSFTIVLLPPPFTELRARAEALLARHRLDEDDPARGWRTDYWTIGDDRIADDATQRELGIQADDYMHRNVSFVRSLAPDLTPAAIVTPDGCWHDLSDCGGAWDRWRAHVREVLAAHAHCVAIAFDTHS